jgi:hypothetical protein
MVMKNVSGDQVVLKRGEVKCFSDPVISTRGDRRVLAPTHVVRRQVMKKVFGLM